MRKKILLFVIALTFFSCYKENNKLDFIGNWSTTSDTNLNIDIQFFKDSIIHDNPIVGRIESAKWKIEENKIYQSFIDNNLSSKQKVVRNTLDYKFNNKKDTLFIKHESDSIYHLIFKRIKNAYNYFENRIGLNIKLEKISDGLILAGNNDYNFNVYVGLKNNKTIAKTDYSNNLNNYLMN